MPGWRALPTIVVVLSGASCAEHAPPTNAVDASVSDASECELDAAGSFDVVNEADAAFVEAGEDSADGEAGTDATDCSWFPGKCGDPECVPLACTNANDYLEPHTATQSDATLAVGFTWCGMCGKYLCAKAGTIELSAAQALDGWATVQSLELGCPFRVMLELAPGSAGGSLKVEGSISGLDVACAPLTCPIDKTFQVLRSNAGVWTISEP